jgi:hypothetical protein
MATVRATVRLPYTTGIPQDVSTNTLHFFTVASPPTQTELDDIAARIALYYGEWGQYLSTMIDRPNCSITMYDLADSMPRQPIYQEPLTIPTAAGTQNLPTEVSVVHSFRGLLTSGQPPARRRGRLYLGPLTILAQPGTGGGFSRPVQVMIDDILTGGQQLGNDAGATGVRWAVYSPTDATTFAVVSNHVNNEWDTQRRRGVLATQKNEEPVVQP